MVQDTKESISRTIEQYRGDVELLCRYLGWLESKKGEDLTNNYQPGDGEKTTISFPVYDSTLLGFVKAVKKTKFLDRNYMYVYRQYRIRSVEDEHRFIDSIQIVDIGKLGAVLSNYVIKGNTRGYVWNQGVTNGVYWHALSRMKELIDFWTVP
ncbi:MAG: hypothetical protein IKI75_05905 [Lachnospiraceae bacterium]|nr:hypothetical protein [Lachnospiraceae bacterium]